jgi:hypothetical protein
MGVTPPVLCHAISLILISTSSLLVDRILGQYDDDSVGSLGNHHDRRRGLAYQLGIWLVLSLSMSLFHPRYSSLEQNEPHLLVLVVLEPWLHLTLATQLLGSILKSRQESIVSPTAPSECAEKCFRRRGVFFLSRVSMASWMTSIAVVVSGVTTRGRHEEEDDDEEDVATFFLASGHVFGGCFLVLWVVQCCRDSEWCTTTSTGSSSFEPPGGRSAIVHYDYPSTSTTSTPILLLDESQWYLWDTRQTWQWLNQRVTLLFMSQHHGDEENAAGAGSSRVLLRTLAPHYLCGDVLDSLTLSQLVHTLHVPYGPAVILARDIARLTQRYPKPPTTSAEDEYDPTTTTTTTTRIGRAMHPSYWLEVHDQEYYHKEHQDRTPHHDAGTPDEDDDPRPATPAPPAIDPELEKRLATLMKERYGIELPTIRRQTSTRHVPHKDQNDDDDNKTSSCHAEKQQDGPHCGGGDDQFTSSRNSSRLVPPILEPSQVTTSPSPPLPLPLLLRPQGPYNHHGLPPPSTLLENMPPRIRAIAERRPDLVQALLLKQQQHQPQTQQQPRRRPPPKQPLMAPDDEEDEMEDEMDDDETTSLVQRQPRRPYKPTEGEIV